MEAWIGCGICEGYCLDMKKNDSLAHATMWKKLEKPYRGNHAVHKSTCAPPFVGNTKHQKNLKHRGG